jgi:signal transduction histidine kinase/CheY-like chemotaxis protein
MLASLHSRAALKSTEANQQLREWRMATLRLFVILTAGAYFVWQFTMTFPNEAALFRTFAVAPAAVTLLGVTYLLLRRESEAAAFVFVGGGLLVISWAIAALRAAEAAMLYPLLTLTAAFVLQPLWGLLTSAISLVLLELLARSLPGVVAPDLIWWVAVSSCLSVIGVWALMHRLFQALNWYVASYAEAESHLQEAREHRAQQVQAFKQLDAAYYRIERISAALQIAWKAAEEAERSKMELAANISHELRTPLNLIAGYSELMMSSPGSYRGIALPEPYRGDISAIYRNAQHLLALTDDVLDLARTEVRRLALAREEVDIHQLVREAVGLVREYVDAKGIELQLDIPDQPWILEVDRLRIRQVLLNLLANAARMTERGQIRVEVRHQATSMRISIADTGPGIAPEQLPGLFQRFNPLDQPRSVHSGTGLGLWLSKQLVELHGGDMGVESTLGIGTTFWFTLPHATSVSHHSDGWSLSLQVPLSYHNERVLILAHRDSRMARLLERRLTGVRIEMTDDITAALELAHQIKATAIITDAASPSQSITGPVPIVRCPLFDPGSLSHHLGVDDYLVKPVSRDDLLRAIRSLARPVRRILIVDDDTRMVRLLQRMLASEQDGYVVATAHNGEEALTQMQSEPPDLLLLDLVMPNLDGFGVLKRMATVPALANVNTIIISARDEEEIAVPMGTTISVLKGDGFQSGEVTAILNAVVSALTPSRALLDERA